MTLTPTERFTYSALLALLPLGLVVQHFESEPQPVTSVTTWRSFIGPVYEDAAHLESLKYVTEEDA